MPTRAPHPPSATSKPPASPGGTRPKLADELTSTHEALVELLATMPHAHLLALICPLLGLQPAEIASVRPVRGTASISALYGRARRAYADFTVELCRHDGRRIRVGIVEVQLSLDLNKVRTWTLLELGLFVEYLIETHLLILSPDPQLRERIRRQVLPKMPISPIFIGADQIPLIHDYTEARARPHQAILGAAFHSREPETSTHQPAHKISALRAAFIALDTFDAHTALRFQAIIMSIAPHNLVHTALTELRQAGEISESRYEQFGEIERGGHSFHRGRQEGHQEGHQDGRRELLFSLIVQRFGPLEAPQLDALTHASSTQLERLGDRILNAPSLEALFDGILTQPMQQPVEEANPPR